MSENDLHKMRDHLSWLQKRVERLQAEIKSVRLAIIMKKKVDRMIKEHKPVPLERKK